MIRISSIITCLCITWATLTQAFLLPDDLVTSFSHSSLLGTSAAISLANNGFDPAKAAKSFASTDTLNSVGMSMLTAGMTHGMLQHFDIPTNVSAIQGLGKHAANQSVHAAVKIGSDLATTGRVEA